MASSTSRNVRFQNDIEVQHFKTSPLENLSSRKHNKAHDPRRCRLGFRGGWQEKACRNPTLKDRVLSRAFSEELESLVHAGHRLFFDPRGHLINLWNKIFLAACLLSLFVDPLFLYMTGTQRNMCIEFKDSLALTLSMIRSLLDLFYAAHILFRFRTAFIAPSSRVFGRGELVIQPYKIARRYLSRTFWFDLITALPLPQLVIWIVIPKLKESTTANRKNILRFSIIFQYLPRLFQIFPLSRQIVMATGVMTETAWAGAAYNLILYMLASHVLGALWYLFSVQRQEACWREACLVERPSCQTMFFDCKTVSSNRTIWYQLSNITSLCTPSNGFYPFGIYKEALDAKLTSSSFTQKYFYCFWWGLKNLSCLGQNLSTSLFIGEITFAIVIGILGLVLFGLLIGNMQSYLQATMVRLEEWRTKRTDMERWMHHRQIPQPLKQCVRRYHQYKWVATRGVDEEALLSDLPMDIRRDIKRHLCLDLVRRVPLFDEMDDRMLEAICERLRPALYTRGTRLVRELDPVDSMLFIIRGYLDSYTTQGGRSGFFNSCRIGAGEFCGEELLTWALDPRPAASLPLSTRTVRAVSEVEAFALVADDLRFVASQFRRLHSAHIRHRFRFYSHHWRTWAACFIQAAWRRRKRRRASMELRMREGGETLPGGSVRCRRHSIEGKGLIKKPIEPDFTVEEED
ncbi:protein CNGC15b-like [Phragmites australis]|uniref:protein CNGC15b-like n=1 Tax=Phragmites australis TaxID=29695 RepID=UPI002D78895E|nr:protein CNGC15b-like [Phragmites australis]